MKTKSRFNDALNLFNALKRVVLNPRVIMFN